MKYLTIDGVAMSDEYPFTLGQLRHFMANRKENGLEKAVRKIGKRVYLNKKLFDQWIEDQAIGEN